MTNPILQSSKQNGKVSGFFDRKAKCHFVSNSMKIDTRAKKKKRVKTIFVVWPVRNFCKNIAAIIFGKSKCHTNREGQSLVGQVNKFSCKTKLAFTTNVGIPFPVLKKQLNKHFLQKYFLF